jgi:hypothetical protein
MPKGAQSGHFCWAEADNDPDLDPAFEDFMASGRTAFSVHLSSSTFLSRTSVVVIRDGLAVDEWDC